jgi:hypothetical protein
LSFTHSQLHKNIDAQVCRGSATATATIRILDFGWAWYLGYGLEFILGYFLLFLGAYHWIKMH